MRPDTLESILLRDPHRVRRKLMSQSNERFINKSTISRRTYGLRSSAIADREANVHSGNDFYPRYRCHLRRRRRDRDQTAIKVTRDVIARSDGRHRGSKSAAVESARAPAKKKPAE